MWHIAMPQAGHIHPIIGEQRRILLILQSLQPGRVRRFPYVGLLRNRVTAARQHMLRMCEMGKYMPPQLDLNL